MRRVTPGEFGQLTSGGFPPGQMWTGHAQIMGLTYRCGCGQNHTVGKGVLPIRDLRKVPVHTVLVCEFCGWVTLVKVKGVLRAKSLRSVAATNPASSQDEAALATGTLLARGVAAGTAEGFVKAVRETHGGDDPLAVALPQGPAQSHEKEDWKVTALTIGMLGVGLGSAAGAVILLISENSLLRSIAMIFFGILALGIIGLRLYAYLPWGRTNVPGGTKDDTRRS